MRPGCERFPAGGLGLGLEVVVVTIPLARLRRPIIEEEAAMPPSALARTTGVRQGGRPNAMGLTGQKVRATGTRNLGAEILLLVGGGVEGLWVRGNDVGLSDEDIAEGRGSGGVCATLEETVVAASGGGDGEVGGGGRDGGFLGRRLRIGFLVDEGAQ